MAHSDALIFLTNITWIFFLFLFTYFFFVSFVLPTFYKKFRARVLIKSINFLGGILAVRDVLVSLVFCTDVLRGLGASLTSLFKASNFLFANRAAQTLNVSLPAGSPKHSNSVALINSYKLDLVFAEISTNGVVFTRYLKA